MKKLTTKDILDYTQAKEKQKNVKTPGNSNVTTNQSLQLINVNNNEKIDIKRVCKLTENERKYILQSSAAFVSNQTQADKLRCNYNTILHNQKQYSDEIQVIRETYLARLADVPFSHKKIRLEQYQMLYKQMLDLYLKAIEIKDLVMINKRLESLLDKARVEIEGNKVTFQGRLDIVHDDPALLESAKEIIDLVDFEVIE